MKAHIFISTRSVIVNFTRFAFGRQSGSKPLTADFLKLAVKDKKALLSAGFK
jgi:hypothetical protein